MMTKVILQKRLAILQIVKLFKYKSHQIVTFKSQKLETQGQVQILGKRSKKVPISSKLSHEMILPARPALLSLAAPIHCLHQILHVVVITDQCVQTVTNQCCLHMVTDQSLQMIIIADETAPLSWRRFNGAENLFSKVSFNAMFAKHLGTRVAENHFATITAPTALVIMPKRVLGIVLQKVLEFRDCEKKCDSNKKLNRIAAHI